MLERFLMQPISTYVLLGLLIIIVICLVATILKFLLHFIFAKIKFTLCLIFAVLVIGALSGRFAYKPIERGDDNPVSSQIVSDAADQFKGIFNKKLPFLAWKFEEMPSGPSQLVDDLFESEPGEGETAPTEQNQKVYIKVSYLPFGNVVLSYDLITRKFGLAEGLQSDIFGGILQGVDPDLLQNLPKAS